MSNSSSLKQFNYPLSKKITNRNPVFRSSTNFAQQSLINKPFSRKPINQGDQQSLRSSKIVQKQLDISVLQKSLLDVQSVVFGDRSVRQSKFVRTNRNGFLSPKSRNKSRQQSFSPDHSYGTQSLIIRAEVSQNKKYLKDTVKQKQNVLSQSSVEQNQNYIQKSISTNSLFRRNNKTRNMILSKFSQLGRKSKDKTVSNKLDTSIQAACNQNQKQQRKRVQKINNELKLKYEEIQKQCEYLNKQNQNLDKQNAMLKTQVNQLKKKIQQLQSKPTIALQQKTSSQNNLQYGANINTRLKPQIQNQQINENKKCDKCEQKQKSNQKQMTYFENVIKKNQTQLIALRKKQTQLSKQNTQINTLYEQTKYKLNELLEYEKISTQNEQKLQECVNQLKQQVAKLKNQLRYLNIQNSVLLKIKNENLKLKIDITKIQDQRDYFKMKVIQIHKKHGRQSLQGRNSKGGGSQKFIRDNNSGQSNNKRSINNNIQQRNNKFYLDSTQTQQMDNYNIGIQRKCKKSNTIPNKNEKILNRNKGKLSQSQTYSSSLYADTLFDLTSQESQNSY